MLPDRRPAFPLRRRDPGARGGRQGPPFAIIRFRSWGSGGTDASAILANTELPPDLSHFGFQFVDLVLIPN
jgi:hypothetical protein